MTLVPAFTELVPVKPEYIGSDYYFERSQEASTVASFIYRPVTVNELETLRAEDRRRFRIEECLTSNAIASLRRAICNFIVGGCIRRLQDRNARLAVKKYSFLVHTEAQRAAGVPNPDGNISRRILICVANSHTGLYCGKIIGEYIEKLIDRGHPRDRTLQMITYIMGAFARVEIRTKVPPIRPSDPDDEIFVLCALEGNADYLISDDKSLLTLASNYVQPRIEASITFAGVINA